MERKIDSVKRLYHGTGKHHTVIDPAYSRNPYRDFGAGYYTTTYFQQACRWAERNQKRWSQKYGTNGLCWVYEYQLQQVPQDMRIKELLQYDSEWLDFIVDHREKGREDSWEIVYDRMADGRLNAVLNGYVYEHRTKEETLAKLQFTNPQRDQYCFKSNASVSLLKRTNTWIYRNGMWEKLGKEALT